VAPQPSSPTDQRDQRCNRVSRLLKSHAPPDWERRFRATELLDAVIDGEPIQMFVMAADIRESTTLMKESVRLERFAAIMDRFVSSVRLGPSAATRETCHRASGSRWGWKPGPATS
jgi:class 3 adenylate cyclase